MKKKFLYFLVIILLLACRFTAPQATATPITQVVFRSPGDMNLQPADVPDLVEQPVENPATEPLLPEALDQDQRVYVSLTQNIYIHNDIIMVPEQTTRKPDDIVNYVVRRARPNIVIAGNGEPISIGNWGTLYLVSNYCSSRHDHGYILIMIRNNMVVVLVGCGSDITRDSILRWGRIIDGRINAPAQPDEIGSNDIPAQPDEIGSNDIPAKPASFEEEYNSGLGEWNLFGSPPSYIDTGVGNPAPSYQNNGDSMYNNNAVSKELFTPVPQMTFQVDISLGNNDPAWIAFGLSRILDPGDNRDDQRMIVGMAGDGNTIFIGGLPDYCETRSLTRGVFYRFKLVVTETYELQAYLNGEYVCTTSYTVKEFENKPLIISGRSGLVDNVMVQTP